MNKTEAAIRNALRDSASREANWETVAGCLLASEIPGAELHGVEVYVRGRYQMALGWLYNGLIATVVMDYTTGETVRSDVDPDHVAVDVSGRNARTMIDQWLADVNGRGCGCQMPTMERVKMVRSIPITERVRWASKRGRKG